MALHLDTSDSVFQCMQDAPGSDQSSGRTGGDVAPPPQTPTASYAAQGVPVVGPIVRFVFYGRGKVVKSIIFGAALMAVFLICGWRFVRPMGRRSNQIKPQPLMALVHQLRRLTMLPRSTLYRRPTPQIPQVFRVSQCLQITPLMPPILPETLLSIIITLR